MSDEQPFPGLWCKPWIGEAFAIKVPETNIDTREAKSETLTSGGALRVGRLYIAPGLPNIFRRFEIGLTWRDLQSPALLDRMNDISAYGYDVPLVIFKQTTDIWDGDGSNKTFYMAHRPAFPTITPPTMFPDFPTRFESYAADRFPSGTPTVLTPVPKTHATIFTDGDPTSGQAWYETDGHYSDEGLWIATVRVGDAPAKARGTLKAVYIPLISAYVSKESGLSYAVTGTEKRAFTMKEIG